MDILLFDMDGVLLAPHGYHRAMQSTVEIVARLLGFEGHGLSAAEIALFEAGGVTCEWDTNAICAALMLQAAWAEGEPEPAGLPPLLNPGAVVNTSKNNGRQAPDFGQFARVLGRSGPATQPPLERAEALLCPASSRQDSPQTAAMRRILQTGRTFAASLTHQIQQELVLGSELFTRTYGQPARLRTPGYLLTYDAPRLSPAERQGLLAWLGVPDRRAVIFTNRPSLAPVPGASTPEAEIGARLVGLEELPILGWGGLVWLAGQRGANPDLLSKPAPIHALAALRRACGDSPEAALQAAADLALDGRIDPGWQRLAGAQVTVFEDAIVGLLSLNAAGQILQAAGVPLAIRLVGVSAQPEKQVALAGAGAQVFSSLPEALRAAGCIA